MCPYKNLKSLSSIVTSSRYGCCFKIGAEISGVLYGLQMAIFTNVVKVLKETDHHRKTKV